MKTLIKFLRRSHPMLLTAALLLVSLPGFAGTPPANTPITVDAKSLATPVPDAPQSANLGSINVKAMRELVQTLQQVKVALHTSFTNDPKLVDQMVCNLGTNQAGYGSATVLDCGTQGWYSRRGDITQLSMICQCASNLPDLGHPWHSTRTLTHTQLMYLKQMLKELPAPGKGEVVLVDNQGKTITTIKNDEKPNASINN